MVSVLKKIWIFLGVWQTPWVRILHLLILFLVLTQITISNWMKGTQSTVVPFDLTYFFTWLHIFCGFILLALTLLLLASCFRLRGIRHFYPYLWGDVEQIKDDLNVLYRLRLPDSSPKGLAAMVQGLGLAGLSVVILSGIVWFFLWIMQSPLDSEARAIHKSLTILIEVYIFGHGGVGILHFIIWYRKSLRH